jgi:hypothetical protein
VTGLLKEGASIGPSGRSGSRASTVQDAGCGLDPDGRCVSDAGCGIDPSGRCILPVRVSATQDAGCGLDPSGKCSTGH